MDQMCFNVPRLPHETHAVPARVVEKVPNHLRLSRIFVFGGRHDPVRFVAFNRISMLCVKHVVCADAAKSGPAVFACFWGCVGWWANNFDVLWRS